MTTTEHDPAIAAFKPGWCAEHNTSIPCWWCALEGSHHTEAEVTR